MLKEVDQILATGTSERLEALRSDPRNVGLRDLFRLHQVRGGGMRVRQSV